MAFACATVLLGEHCGTHRSLLLAADARAGEPRIEASETAARDDNQKRGVECRSGRIA
jgi:hypothetical protein